MKPQSDFMTQMADFDLDPKTIIWRAESPTAVRQEGAAVALSIPFRAYILQAGLQPDPERPLRMHTFFLELWDGSVLRLTSSPTAAATSVMIDQSREHPLLPLSVREMESCWEVLTVEGECKAVFTRKQPPREGWSTLISPSFDSFSGTLFPDSADLRFSSHDQFFPEKVESLPLAFIEHPGLMDSLEDGRAGARQAFLFSFEASHNEQFSGTGERFAPLSLRGATFSLENTDALGVNSRRAYKNIPFSLSSRGYGLFIHSSAHIRLSLADVSTRAVQARVEEPLCDLFFIAGTSPERILYQYRRLTGFPPPLPLWSYGIWMSRMTYFSAEEIEQICERLRKEEYPCDVIHIDTGWFERDWVCEWKFSRERFPDPHLFMQQLREKGFRVSLWQTPNIGKENFLYNEALEKGVLPPVRTGNRNAEPVSDFSGQDMGGVIDFTNPEAVAWYQEKIGALLEMGAAAIKTDFGEKINMQADYKGMDAKRLRNLYALLYQKAAFEKTLELKGAEDTMIWARAGWAGCQRYPIHWGGDAASTWDGMAASLRGGLHLGLSGFGFWSHDVPGFHGVPEFMNSPPSDALYMRWTQLAVFTSHMRYHGTSPREPWYFPEISSMIQRWWRLRYALIPYLFTQGQKCSESGFPLLRALFLMYPQDPVCWQIDNQFFCGDAFMVCPVMNDQGVRDIYLPEGTWIDFWTGESLEGGRYLKQLSFPLDRMGVYCPEGSRIPIYPRKVQSTDEMDLSLAEPITIDGSFEGIFRVLEG